MLTHARSQKGIFVSHLGVFYFKLSHFYQVLPEGHNTPGLEVSQFCGKNIVQLTTKKKGELRVSF